MATGISFSEVTGVGAGDVDAGDGEGCCTDVDDMDCLHAACGAGALLAEVHRGGIEQDPR